MTDKDLTGKTLERQVADAYRQMGATKVEHDVEIAGNQIDVYVELPAPGQSVLRIAVEVKDYQRPVGVKIVNDFAQIVDLLYRRRLIHEGVLVGGSGFSKPARNAAEEHGLRLLEPADLAAMDGQPLPPPPVQTPVPRTQVPLSAPPARTAPWTGPRIDPDNPPYARLRELLKAAFDTRSLRRIEDHEPFTELRHRFAPGDNVDDLIDEIFEFCRVHMRWDELLAFVAEYAQDTYNRFAQRWGWPQTQPAASSPAIDRQTVERALRMARRTLAILEEQAAAYTALTVPAHLRIELEEQRRKVAELEARLQ